MIINWRFRFDYLLPEILFCSHQSQLVFQNAGHLWCQNCKNKISKTNCETIIYSWHPVHKNLLRHHLHFYYINEVKTEKLFIITIHLWCATDHAWIWSGKQLVTLHTFSTYCLRLHNYFKQYELWKYQLHLLVKATQFSSTTFRPNQFHPVLVTKIS